ncbi:MAG TPA: CBS domain-containing protein [Lacibacter sp.]|nr:CBS domain-containing protein [Lacibacter sp.]HMO89270.1 CBS domain-containing protein [Lacibacter sp.]HMP86049.1 CBS domain-containing protein [Lacibacter sp.]
MRTAQDILNSKPPIFNFIDADSRVIEGLQLMNSVNLSYLVVMKEGEFQGIFSERDYSRNVILKGLASHSATIREVMSTFLPVIGPLETVEKCMQLLNSHKTRYLVVFNDDQQFQGVVTINDVLREAISNRELVFDQAEFSQAIELQDKIF